MRRARDAWDAHDIEAAECIKRRALAVWRDDGDAAYLPPVPTPDADDTDDARTVVLAYNHALPTPWQVRAAMKHGGDPWLFALAREAAYIVAYHATEPECIDRSIAVLGSLCHHWLASRLRARGGK